MLEITHNKEQRIKLRKTYLLRYDLLEMDTNSEDPEEETVKETKEMQASKLDGKTQKLINLIFDKDMFNSALKKYDLGMCYLLL